MRGKQLPSKHVMGSVRKVTGSQCVMTYGPRLSPVNIFSDIFMNREKMFVFNVNLRIVFLTNHH